MSTLYLVLVHILAVIGLFTVLGIIGALIFTAKFADPGSGTRPASEVVAAHTGNVRVLAPAEYPTGEVIDLRDPTCLVCGDSVAARSLHHHTPTATSSTTPDGVA